MDSSDLQLINPTGSPSNDIADTSLMITPSKRDIFLSTYRRQRFILPTSMMHYITKKRNSNVHEQLIETCKYFFIKNPFVVLGHLFYIENGWSYFRDYVDTDTISCKLWITDKLIVSPEYDDNNSVASSIIPKIHQCDINCLDLFDQVISFNEFKFLCSSVRLLELHRVIVKNEDGTELAFEKLIEQLPKVITIEYSFANPSNNISKNTFEKLWKIPYLSNYNRFYLYNIPEDFDIDCFYSFMKKNKNTRVYLRFSEEISEEYETRLEAIVDEIIDTKNHEYRPPLIDFPGLRQKKQYELYHLCEYFPDFDSNSDSL